ncbi:MAG: MBL fold metallo-hydrolase [Gammaproteobacteria bacterium]|nr:MAG: MBL fold metallo-hydrolase [Gammaproteobacteria bacterium]
MLFRQLFDHDTWTYTYLLADDTGNAVLIDPVVGQVEQYLRLFKELKLQLKLAIDTHVHADHITALGALRDATGCISAMGEPATAACVSRTFKDGDLLEAGKIQLRALHTPGHTDDSYSFVLESGPADRVFTGDTLFIRGSGRTDFQNGSARDLYNSLHGKLLKLPDTMWVYPGHDYKGWTVSTIGEEKQHNPRANIHPIAAFEKFMAELKLPDPKYMDVAVPANRACGKTA